MQGFRPSAMSELISHIEEYNEINMEHCFLEIRPVFTFFLRFCIGNLLIRNLFILTPPIGIRRRFETKIEVMRSTSLQG
jgi:hypothetical protein